MKNYMRLSTKSKVVIDTNVFISGVLFGGNPGKVLKLFGDDAIQVVMSPQIELEILVKLAKFSRDVVPEMRSLLEQKAILVVPTKKVTICRDPKDNMFLEAVWESGADFLITGDKDLLDIGKFKGIRIVTPAEFLG